MSGDERYTGPRRNVFWMPVDQLADDLVQTGDFGWWSLAWPSLEKDLGRWEWSDLEKDILLNGLEDPVELQSRAGSWGSWRNRIVLTDGHHRVAALRKMGWKRFPYRWFPLGYNSQPFQSRPLTLEEVALGERIGESR